VLCSGIVSLDGGGEQRTGVGGARSGVHGLRAPYGKWDVKFRS
jgi:hypothetical protein